jgi:uncharacterized membrane protein
MVIWTSGIFYPALLPGNSSGLLPGIFPDKIYSLVCHRESVKSIFISGKKLEVCARCTGIYTGALFFSFVALAFPRLRPASKRWLLLSMVPMGLDVFLYSVGIYDYSKWISLSTGIILGSVSIIYIFMSIEDYILELKLG